MTKINTDQKSVPTCDLRTMTNDTIRTTAIFLWLLENHDISPIHWDNVDWEQVGYIIRELFPFKSTRETQ